MGDRTDRFNMPMRLCKSHPTRLHFSYTSLIKTITSIAWRENGTNVPLHRRFLAEGPPCYRSEYTHGKRKLSPIVLIGSCAHERKPFVF